MTEYEISAGADQPVTGHIPERGYKVDPWQLARPGLAIDQLARTESVFALSNGHIGMRGTLEEGEPRGLPGTYLNGFYEQHALPYAEAGYGYPEAGQTIVNVTDGKLIRLLVDDEPLDMRYGRGARTRAGPRLPRRDAASPDGVGLADRAGRIRYAPSGWCRSPSAPSPPSVTRSSRSTTPLQLVVQSELVANEPMPRAGQGPPCRRDARATAAGRLRDAAPMPARCWSTAPSQPSCAWPPPWTTGR